jgi:hypothetical protein
LLAEALRTAIAADEAAAARLDVVDAFDEASARFYTRDDLVVARVIEVVDRPGGRKVVMELVGDAGELVEALVRARVVAA